MKWRPGKSSVIFGVAVVASLALHAVLLWQASERNVAVAIFSAGSHTPIGAILLAGGLLLVRFILIVILPGVLAAWLVFKVLSCALPSTTQEEHPATNLSVSDHGP